MANQLHIAGVERPARQYRFAPPRRFRADFAWPELKVMLEIEGGASYATVRSSKGKQITGHHVHPKGYESDCEKYNLAALDGWIVLRATGAMIRDGRALQAVSKALGYDTGDQP